MQQLARELGVRQSSLYNHVAGRHHVVELMGKQIFEDIPLPTNPRPWRGAVEHGARQYHATCIRHAQLVAMLAASPLDDPAAGPLRSYWTNALVTDGFNPGTAELTIAVLARFILGSVIEHLRSRQNGPHTGISDLCPQADPPTTEEIDFAISLLLWGLETARYRGRCGKWQ
jgi:AcrR family transcriptional regulator